MKVTIVVSTLTAGGAERAAVNMANYWARSGWQPTILTTSQRGRAVAYELDSRVEWRDLGWRRGPTDEEMDRASVDAILGGLDMHDPIYDPLLTDLVLLLILRHGIAQTKPDAVISMIDVMNVRMLAATEGLPVRRFVSERCDPWLYSIQAYEPLRRRLYPRADGVIAQTAEVAEYFAKRGAACHAIPNMVLPAPPGASGGNGRHVMVALARLVADKRLNIIIRAFARIAGAHPEWDLRIWGEGPQRPFLESVIEEVGGTERIRLCGHATDVYAVLGKADLFAMASVAEGFPNSLCEAMASGLAPVVFDCGPGVREIVRDGIDGVLVRTYGPEPFAAALDRLMGDDAERERLAARAPEVAERFSAERVMQRWEEVLA
ncbi:MAG TPA: glycosyltransferase family 4 protein [Thermoanaerobaculia bacterium]|nr:glycosyltransferase family 4 protein [Thermoanaerobaculia bacterium]